MIHVHNIFALPLLLVAWSVGLYLTAAAARVMLGRCRSPRAVRLAEALAPFTDGVPSVLERWLRRRGYTSSPWLPWAIFFAGGLIVHQLLLRAILVVG